MTTEINFILFYDHFELLMKKHFNKMDRCSYLNADGEVTDVTLEQQTRLFLSAFTTAIWESDPERYIKLMEYFAKEQDIMFYNLNYRDKLNREAERYIIANIATPIYI